MDFVKGLIVRSKAGHDKGNFFVVTQLEDKYAYICDGKRRKLENPKKKKLIHLSVTNTQLNESEMQTDKCIKTKIRSFEES